jgi:hypothetical protein
MVGIRAHYLGKLVVEASHMLSGWISNPIWRRGQKVKLGILRGFIHAFNPISKRAQISCEPSRFADRNVIRDPVSAAMRDCYSKNGKQKAGQILRIAARLTKLVEHFFIELGARRKSPFRKRFLN